MRGRSDQALQKRGRIDPVVEREVACTVKGRERVVWTIIPLSQAHGARQAAQQGPESTERQRRVCSCVEGWHASLEGPANKAPTASSGALAMGRLRLQSYVGVVTNYKFAL